VQEIFFGLLRDRELGFLQGKLRNKKSLFLNINMSSFGVENYDNYENLFETIDSVYIPFKISSNIVGPVWILVVVQMKLKSIEVHNIFRTISRLEELSSCIFSWLLEVATAFSKQGRLTTFDKSEWSRNEIFPSINTTDTNLHSDSGIFVLQSAEKLSRGFTQNLYIPDDMPTYRCFICESIIKGSTDVTPHHIEHSAMEAAEILKSMYKA
jgi:hypothetical protein